MSNICLGNLLPSSVLAYDNIDLIPNGYIPEVGTTARPRTRNAGGQVISSRETIRLLPADRLYAEFWYGVSSRVTGTNLRDAGQGAFDALGFLGGGELLADGLVVGRDDDEAVGGADHCAPAELSRQYAGRFGGQW